MDDAIRVTEKDELIMKLVHYFVTKEDYAPIMVNGVKNEIWLENLDANYKIIRINSNYIHNIEQLDFDMYKINSVNRQIKKKTLTRKLKTLNILTDTNEDITIKNYDNIDNLIIKGNKDLENKDGIISLFPQIVNEKINDLQGLDFLLNVSNDINKKTEKDNQFYESVFKKKKIVITKVLIYINVAMYILTLIGELTNSFDIFTNFALNPYFVKHGQLYRLITSGFLHGSIIHLLCNMYSLNIIGSQIESFIGKKKYLFVYFISMIVGNLLSCVLTNSWSIGASGAIFGLIGSIMYFGYHYRLYLGSVLKQQLIPLLIVNLAIGLFIPNIDMSAHIGGLVGGLFATMAVGVEKKTKKSESINAFICLIILIAFLSFVLFK